MLDGSLGNQGYHSRNKWLLLLRQRMELENRESKTGTEIKNKIMNHMKIKANCPMCRVEQKFQEWGTSL